MKIINTMNTAISIIVAMLLLFVSYQSANAETAVGTTTVKVGGDGISIADADSSTATKNIDEEQVVNIYYSGKEHLIRPLLDRFTEETSIKVNLVTGGKAKLVTRLEQEGRHTPADLLLTVDIGNIYRAQEKGLLQPISSDFLNSQIPSNLRSKDGLWYGITVRARAIFYAKDRVSKEELSTYEALGDEKWKGRILVRSSSSIYNQSLLASIIAHRGEDAAREWARSIVANFARPPKGGDRSQIKGVAAGEGDIAIANSYYYARLLTSKKESNRRQAEKVGIFFPNQNDRGTHINIRGGGVTKYAKHKGNAIKLLEFLASDESQEFFANVNYEFPVKEGIKLPKILEDWGSFKRDSIDLEKIGKNNRKAIMIFDEVGWS